MLYNSGGFMKNRPVAAIILGAGRGSRLKDIAPPYSKTILPVNALPVIGYATRAVESYVDKIILVAHPSTATNVYKALLESLQNDSVETRLTLQEKPLGMADAMGIGFSALEEDHTVVVVAGDNIILDDRNVKNTLDLVLDHSSHDSQCQLAWTFRELMPNEARRFSVYQEIGEGKGMLLEKPEDPPSKICWCGPVVFGSSREAMQRIQTLKLSPRGEYEATDLMNTYIRTGESRHIRLQGEWFDIGTPESLIEAQTVQSLQMLKMKKLAE